MSLNSISSQFTEPSLVAAYDSLNALGDDSEFFCELVKKLSAETIIDLGCGTGLLTCELARRGHTMIGVEPAARMLDRAREKAHSEKVKWIHGGHERFEDLKADMILMSSHVAQFFIDDHEWESMLRASYKALNANGYIVFDARPPVFPPFQTWPTQCAPKRVVDPGVGPIDWYYRLIEIQGHRVRYELHFYFINSDEKLTSTDELIFRSKVQLTTSLKDAGFQVEALYGDWDGSPITPISPEMVFVARKI